MNVLEIRIIAYAIAAILSLGGSAYLGHRLTVAHYESLIAQDQRAQNQALAAANEKLIEYQKSADAVLQASEKKYEDLKASADANSILLASSVRTYATLHSGVVSATSTAAAAANAASQSAASASELAGLVQQASSACLDDSARLTALQIWAQPITVDHGMAR